MKWFGLACALSLFACTGVIRHGGFVDDTPDGGPGVGPTGDDLAPIEMSIKWHQDKRSEIVACHYFKTPNDAAAEINRFTVDFPNGSHHVHIYRSDTPDPDRIEDCSAGIDWRRWSLVVGAQTKPLDWTLPEGITAPIDGHQQLLVQVHWLNTTDAPIDREIKLTFHTTKTSKTHLGVALGVSKDTGMAPHQTKKVGSWVPLPEGARLVAFMGHFHARGTGYTADIRKMGDASGRVIYQAQDEQTFEFKSYPDPKPQATNGEGLSYECDFSNTLDIPLTWGPDTNKQEHCNLAAYYYPAGPKISNVYIVGEVKDVSIPATNLMAGQSVDGEVELAEQAGQLGVDVSLTSDGSLFDGPATVHVPAWQSKATFTMKAMRPARATLEATAGAEKIAIPWNVGGLLLSEVYYKPNGTVDGKQWVELENLTDVPIDLSHYSVGGGSQAYAQARVALGDRPLPPHGCLVVGGPSDLPADDPLHGVLSVAEPFAPALPPTETPEGGVALFDVPIAATIDTTTIPLDALVYGGSNPANLVGGDGKPLKAIAGVSAGWSLERTQTWQAQANRSPGVCKVINAN